MCSARHDFCRAREMWKFDVAGEHFASGARFDDDREGAVTISGWAQHGHDASTTAIQLCGIALWIL